MPPVTRRKAVELHRARPALPTLLTSLPEVELRRRIFLLLNFKERATACSSLAVLIGAVARAQGRLRSLAVLSRGSVHSEQLLHEALCQSFSAAPCCATCA